MFYFYGCRLTFWMTFHDFIYVHLTAPLELESFLSFITRWLLPPLMWLWATFSGRSSGSDEYHYPNCPYSLGQMTELCNMINSFSGSLLASLVLFLLLYCLNVLFLFFAPRLCLWTFLSGWAHQFLQLQLLSLSWTLKRLFAFSYPGSLLLEGFL